MSFIGISFTKDTLGPCRMTEGSKKRRLSTVDIGMKLMKTFTTLRYHRFTKFDFRCLPDDFGAKPNYNIQFLLTCTFMCWTGREPFFDRVMLRAQEIQIGMAMTDRRV